MPRRPIISAISPAFSANSPRSASGNSTPRWRRPVRPAVPPMEKGDGPGQGLCRLCAGPSRHVRADVSHRASRYEAAVAAARPPMPRSPGWPARSAPAATSRFPNRRCRSIRPRPSRGPGRWSTASPCCCSMTGFPTFCAGCPKGTDAETLLDAMLKIDRSAAASMPRQRVRRVNLGKVRARGAKHLTFARNCSRTAASRSLAFTSVSVPIDHACHSVE